mgnify:CR=1 FL=1
MTIAIDNLRKIYDQIENSRIKYGDLKKCELHIHTPASHDYRLTKNSKKNYIDLTTEEVINLAYETGYLTEEVKEKLILENRIKPIDITQYSIKSYKISIPHKDFKEYLSYMLIAHKLYECDISVAVISDHNSIKGYYKLKYALEKYYIERIKRQVTDVNKKCIYLFLGVEISCSDHNHLVGIFPENYYKKVEQFLEEFISSEEEGTHETTYTMLSNIVSIGGIGYIAHINTSNLLGTEAYKKKLFNYEELKIMGLTNLEKQETIEQKLLKFSRQRKKNFGFVHEGDAHTIEDLGIRNTWIKFSEFSFMALVKAFENHEISIYTKKPAITNKYIKGIFIESGENGFLTSSPQKTSDTNNFCIEFSRDLNCIIGGRGTGKSTILNIIDVILSSEAPNKEILEFICHHYLIYIVFHVKGTDYVIRFIPQNGKQNNSYINTNPSFLKGSFEYTSRDSDTLVLKEHWTELFEVRKVESSEIIKLVQDRHLKEQIIKEIYRKGYSINLIMSRIQQGKVGEFVKEVIFDGVQFKDLDNYMAKLRKTKTRSFQKYIRENIINVLSVLEKRKHLVEKSINEFNEKNKNLIKIEYAPKIKNAEFYLDDLVYRFTKDKHLKNFYITWEDVESYIYDIVKKIGLFEFINLLLNNKFKELNGLVSLKNYSNQEQQTLKDIEEEYIAVDDKNVDQVYRVIKNELFSMENSQMVLSCFERYFEVIDDFTIMFNVNSKESVRSSKVSLKNIEHLSMGQKVVAILTFIFQFGIHTNDNTPLIIDQPEDNLDNQYIFKNLVKSLQQIKNQRQIIVVTHSSTIVTNADAEQVIVLESDNNKGWLQAKGYPSDKNIMRYVVTYLEGGEESFKHKMGTYSTILNY